jgi:hypothetical protein
LKLSLSSGDAKGRDLVGFHAGTLTHKPRTKPIDLESYDDQIDVNCNPFRAILSMQ